MTMLFNGKSSWRQPKLSRKSGHACSCGGRKQGDADDCPLVVVDTINSRWCQNGNIMIYRGESNITWDYESSLTFIFLKVWGVAFEIGDEDWEGGVRTIKASTFLPPFPPSTHLFHLFPSIQLLLSWRCGRSWMGERWEEQADMSPGKVGYCYCYCYC